MKALCVTPDRTLVVCDVPEPSDPPAEHLVLDMAACAINPGDKFFLKAPPLRDAPRKHDVWGASGAGTVIAVGAGVPGDWLGRHVAVAGLGRTKGVDVRRMGIGSASGSDLHQVLGTAHAASTPMAKWVPENNLTVGAARGALAGRRVVVPRWCTCGRSG
jgi:NADPH:quinone reductase-like Zn-dependent oxidoreductase